uniref:UPAR/Ly6 domain-containing protein n=1 Tax=Monodon monoceros TaxID=40151 RepID=A0A8C6CKA4_MONMO
MDWLLFLLLPGALVVLYSTMKFISCTSCDEFVGKNCRKNLGSCHSRYPDFACQTKEVYSQHFTGKYMYRYSILGCPRRCVEYIHITEWEKNVFFCCNTSYCNSLSVKDEVPFNSIASEDLA